AVGGGGGGDAVGGDAVGGGGGGEAVGGDGVGGDGVGGGGGDLDLRVPTASGMTLGESLAYGPLRWPIGEPVTSLPAFLVVHGNLAPDGAVIKAAAASPRLLRHRGPAVVFGSYQEMRSRID